MIGDVIAPRLRRVPICAHSGCCIRAPIRTCRPSLSPRCGQGGRKGSEVWKLGRWREYLRLLIGRASRYASGRRAGSKRCMPLGGLIRRESGDARERFQCTTDSLRSSYTQSIRDWLVLGKPAARNLSRINRPLIIQQSSPCFYAIVWERFSSHGVSNELRNGRPTVCGPI